jgi:hypothetical protein
MWEPGGCLESVQQDAILRCGQLDSHDIGTCEMWARTESTGTISPNATGRCVTRRCYICGGAECMHQCSCS